MAQPLGHVLQDEVAGIVAMGIVDRLEVIQVDQQQRHAVAVAARIVQGAFGEFHQVPAVAKPGQRVVMGGVLQLRFAHLQLAIGLAQLVGTDFHGACQVALGAVQQGQARVLFLVGLVQGQGPLLQILDARGERRENSRASRVSASETMALAESAGPARWRASRQG